MPGLQSLLTALQEGGKPDGSLAQKAISPLAGLPAQLSSPEAAGPVAGTPLPAPVGQAPTQGIDPQLLQLIMQALASPGIGDMPGEAGVLAGAPSSMPNLPGQAGLPLPGR